MEDWILQIVMSKKEKKGLRKKPYAFTEQGVAMLSGVLKSDIAVKISIQIIQAFVQIRKLIIGNTILFRRVNQLEIDTKLEHIF